MAEVIAPNYEDVWLLFVLFLRMDCASEKKKTKYVH
jgi:hypothetical protein